MRRPLPLQQINAFDAAARHLSFSRAAQELNVQQPAISRQVAALEATLNTQLFLRSKPRLTLTEDGADLAKAVQTGFDAIRDALTRLESRKGHDTLIVSASIGFTSFFLLPRLAEFQTAHPDINLQIVTRDQNEDFDPSACDAVVLFGEDGLPDMQNRLIFRETMMALCHPRLLPEGRPFDLDTLSQQKLLHMTSMDHRGDWTRYFARIGTPIPAPPAHDGYVSYMVYLRAIQNGLGIGIGWRQMMTEYLAKGTLVRACGHDCQTTRGYFCSLTRSGVSKRGATDFLDWLARGGAAAG